MSTQLKRTDIQYSEYSRWSSQDYLRDYYSEVMPDEKFALEFLVDWAGKIKGNPLMAEFGCGPTVHHLFPVVRMVSEVHMGEYLESNRAEVERWLRHDPAAHDWREFTRATFELEGNVSPSPADLAEREEETRAKVTAVVGCDVRDENPLGLAGRGAYPLVTSHYCAEVVAADLDVWRGCMRNISSLVAPGGTLIVSACGAANYYTVGEHYFPCAGVTAGDLLASLQENGYGDIDLRVRLVPSHSSQGYSSVLFARGVLPS